MVTVSKFSTTTLDDSLLAFKEPELVEFWGSGSRVYRKPEG